MTNLSIDDGEQKLVSTVMQFFDVLARAISEKRHTDELQLCCDDARRATTLLVQHLRTNAERLEKSHAQERMHSDKIIEGYTMLIGRMQSHIEKLDDENKRLSGLP